MFIHDIPTNWNSFSCNKDFNSEVWIELNNFYQKNKMCQDYWKYFFYIKNTLHTKYMVFQLLWCSGNAASVFLLTRKALSSFFNHLLAALCLFDMIYLITMLLEALRNLGLGTTTHTITIPSFLYPLNAIMMMASIYMTLVIGLERLGHSTIPR